MLFNSYFFLLLFLPLVLLGYYGLNKIKKYKASNWFLIGMSLWFYGFYNPWYFLIISFSIIFNYILSKALVPTLKKPKKCLLFFGITINILIIFYYKYFNFFLENVNTVFGTDFILRKIVLPLGISFFTFQQISYLVDSYRGQTKDYNFSEYALFVVFFPQLVAGPIVLHKEMIPQFRDEKRRAFQAENFSRGFYIFVRGLFKKVLIADTFGVAVNYGFSDIPGLSSVEALVVSFAYTFQLFFDFSGYSDMAIGLGLMLNYDLPQNFNSPYKATSIRDFWDRWHMTLTRFLRTYVYFPLGGSRKGKMRTYRNVMVVYLVSGIWHGANWTFIVWGLLHGLFSCLNRAFQKIWDRIFVGIRWILTFFTVNLLWVIFRADSLTDAWTFLRKIFSPEGGGISRTLSECFVIKELDMVFSALPGVGCLFTQNTAVYPLLMTCAATLLVLFCKNSKELQFKPNFVNGFVTCVLLVWSVCSLTGISTFLYFGF